MAPLIDLRCALERHLRSAAWFVAVLGAVLGVAGLAQVYLDPEPIAIQSIESLLVLGPALAIVYAGYRVTNSRRSLEDRWSVATWATVGCLVGGALVAGYLLTEWLVGNVVADSTLLLVVGMLSGGVVGLCAAVANQRPFVDAPAVEDEADADRATTDESTTTGPHAQSVAPLGADGRSWYVIHALALADRPLEVETVAAQIAALEAEREEVVYLDLIQLRLPELAAMGVVEYDPATGTARPTDRLESFVESIETTVTPHNGGDR